MEEVGSAVESWDEVDVVLDKPVAYQPNSQTRTVDRDAFITDQFREPRFGDPWDIRIDVTRSQEAELVTCRWGIVV